MPFESHFIVPFGETRHDYEQPEGFDTERFIVDLMNVWSVQRWEVPEATVRSALGSSPPRDLPDAIRRVFALYAAVHGKSLYGDKTPDYMLSMPFLARLLPEVRFVHVVRDGRDVALALREVDWMRQNEVIDCALYWALRVQTARRAGRWLGPQRYCEVRYEELVSNPKAVLRHVCEFFGLRYANSMLDHRASAVELVSSEPNLNEFRTLHMPVTRGLRDWRTQMAHHDLSTFEEAAGEVLVNFDYQLSELAVAL